MDLKLDNKLALVTGSTSGIGRSIAETLLREGARVIVNGRSQQSVDKALSHLDAGDRAIGIPADVGTADGCNHLLAEAKRQGEIEILINNAGIFEPKPFEQITDSDWMRFYEINVLSGVRLSRGVCNSMKQRGWGRIVFISSESGVSIPVEMIQYGMTKSAQLSISRGLAKAMKATGVTVNSVLPGPTWSEGVEQFVEDIAGDKSIDETKKAFFQEARPASLIQRFATTDEVAALVAYVCSEQAAATTGAALRCDGGIVDTCF
ncbi:3-oxoacyl-[acyl-carrier-protein] reductase FabG [Rubripirellula lacrimiformis]|uniref:3-oxoacyl-[acyl-carrier-protein] reductase FabG n=1 Tax=Rubripirellula lacrimiformis TaxID=1930273 RepID=A0A517NJP3_9BACT|nr:SDR family oxidoreductase [Rubripirellula lacrimiformis]QDT07352.1 3-oxoacyl-[acyl-carrier-protein] reductase FabG [Rubripirellula lacrimiformis]